MEKTYDKISKEHSDEVALYMRDIATPVMLKITTGKKKKGQRKQQKNVGQHERRGGYYKHTPSLLLSETNVGWPVRVNMG